VRIPVSSALVTVVYGGVIFVVVVEVVVVVLVVVVVVVSSRFTSEQSHIDARPFLRMSSNHPQIIFYLFSVYFLFSFFSCRCENPSFECTGDAAAAKLGCSVAYSIYSIGGCYTCYIVYYTLVLHSVLDAHFGI